MRRAAFVPALFVAFGSAALLGACTLLTSLDGLSGGPEDDGGAETTASLVDANLGAETSGDTGTSPIDSGEDGGVSRSALYAQAVLADHPIGYWRLEESSGTVAKDETGSHDGTFVSGPILAQPGVAGSRSAKLGKGTQARVHVDSNAYRFAGRLPFSIEAWVQPGEVTHFQWIGSTEIPQVGATRSGWSLFAEADGTVHYEGWQPDGGFAGIVRSVVLAPTLLMTSSTFHQLVITYDGKTLVGYIDGQQGIVQANNGSVPDNGALDWGCHSGPTDCLDDWTIDELAIYSQPLTGERVKAHFDLGN